jgi:hypothetical protein
MNDAPSLELAGIVRRFKQAAARLDPVEALRYE